MIRKEYTGGRYVTYTYNAEGQLAKLTYGDGSREAASYLFEYDSLGRLVRSSEADGTGTVTQRTEHIYDEYNRLKRQNWTLGSKNYSESYTYNDGTNETGSLKTMTTGTGRVLNYSYDPLKRLQKVTVKSGSTSLFSTAYAYRDINSTRTTQQVEFRNVRIGDNGTILEGKKYVYDALGNITEIRQSTSPYNLLIAYEYDAQNQLTSEVHYDGNGAATANITVAYYYDYDTAGNLLKVQKGTVNSAGTLTKTTEQTYYYRNSDWNDLLTAVGSGSISYDGSGNPTSYSNSLGSYTNIRWENGRQLVSMMARLGGTEFITYEYDANGIRTRKELDESGYTYDTLNGKVMREVGQFDGVAKRQVIDFIYDESGRPFAMRYSADGGVTVTTYYYVLNLQGDVVKLVTSSGSVVASYEYDAWGNILSKSGTMADKNPLRYRGYYYDSETGFYYLQSRYYDPANRRFINADSYASTGQGFVGCNMFAYCLNNPVNYIDVTGEGAIAITIATYVVYALVFAISAYGSYVICFKILPYVARQWDEMINCAGDRLVDKLREAGIGAEQEAEHIRDLSALVTSAVERSYAEQAKREYPHTTELHHIVARRARNQHMARARSILAEVGIGVDSRPNLVRLKTGLHRRLHTNAYYTLVDTVIITAYEAANGDRNQQARNVFAALESIRGYLLSMNAIAQY